MKIVVGVASEGVISLKELTITYIYKTSSFHYSNGKVNTCCQIFLLELL